MRTEKEYLLTNVSGSNDRIKTVYLSVRISGISEHPVAQDQCAVLSDVVESSQECQV